MQEIKPSIDELKNLVAETENESFVSIWAEIIADLETPVSAYHKVSKESKYSFLLESVEGGENFGRYSFIGFDPVFILKTEKDVSAVLDSSGDIKDTSEDPYELFKKFLAKYSVVNPDLPFSPGAVGYFGYDTIRFIEPTLKKSYENIEECTTFPDAYFMVPGIVLVFDHVKHKIYVINNVLVDKTSDLSRIYEDSKEKINLVISKLSTPHNLVPLTLSSKEINKKVDSNISKEEWIDIVNKAKEHIKAGDIFQIVLSQRFCIEKENLDSFTIYRALRSINPSPYLYYLNFGGFQIVGSSPEILVKCSPEGDAQVRPIAGTRRRGFNKQRDEELALEMLNDPKERAEHIMLVDLGRNDLGRVCEYGSVKVDRLMEVEKYSHVQHIVSNVTGKLKPDNDSIELIKACFPAGTVSGAPKIRAMEIIYNLEKSARGPYAGCIGYLGFNNEVNTAITIRTMLVRDNKIFIQAGAGIVADSDPELEYLETQNKAAALVQTIERLKDANA